MNKMTPVFKLSPEQKIWLVLILIAAACYYALLPYSEFTSDDGEWILDAFLRLKEHDWFTPRIVTSQHWMNSPLVSWFFAFPLLVSKAVMGVQLLVLGIQLVTILVIRQIAIRLKLGYAGLLPALLFLTLPALLLNYSSKLCNTSFIVFASALFFWSRLCFLGRKRYIFVLLSLAFGIAVHYSFLVYLCAFILEEFLLWSKLGITKSWFKGLGFLSLGLLAAACFGCPGLPHLRSLGDTLVAGSGYMINRSMPIQLSETPNWFPPLELLPALLFVIVFPTRSVRIGSTYGIIWFYTVFSIGALCLLTTYGSWSPHQWTLAFVLPLLILVALGVRWLGHRFGNRVLILLLIGIPAQAAMQSWLVFSWISETGGTGWHGPTLSVKQQVLKAVQDYSPSRVVLGSPGVEVNGSLIGWNALASVSPSSFGRSKNTSTDNQVLIIEERGSEGSYPELSRMALNNKWVLKEQIGSVFLWDPQGQIGGIWPEIRIIRNRSR